MRVFIAYEFPPDDLPCSLGELCEAAGVYALPGLCNRLKLRCGFAGHVEPVRHAFNGPKVPKRSARLRAELGNDVLEIKRQYSTLVEIMNSDRLHGRVSSHRRASLPRRRRPVRESPFALIKGLR